MAKQAAPIPLEVVVFENTVKDLKNLDLYKAEFDEIIAIYAQLCAQYKILNERFVRSRYRIQAKTTEGGAKKAPLVSTLEILRKDILSYASQLGITPMSFPKIKGTAGPARKSVIAEALAKYGGA